MASNSIVLGGEPRQKEENAGATVTPGELLEYAADGDVQPHSTVPATDTDGSAQPRFADRGFGNDGVDDDYSAGERVKTVIGRRGDEINAFLAAGENVSKGDALESAGNGALQAHTGSDDADSTSTQTYYDGAIVAYAAEDVDNSGGGSPVRIDAECA